MGMVSIPRVAVASSLTTAVGTIQLNGDDERAGYCGYYVTPDGAARTITHICWSTGTVATGDTILVQLETIDASTGLPNGVIGGASPNSANQVVADANDNAWFETELANTYALTSGTWLACTFQMTNASKDVILIKSYRYGQTTPVCGWVVTDIIGAATWVKTTYRPNCALKTSLGEYLIPAGGDALENIAYTAVNTGSNPRYIGNKIQCNGKTRLAGFFLSYFDPDYNVTIKLVNASGTVQKGDDTSTDMSVTIDADYRAGTALELYTECMFPCPKTLDADTAYYLVMSPDTASDVRMYRCQYESEAIKNTVFGIPSGWSVNHITATTDWDNVDHVTETAAYISGLLPVYDQIYFPDVANVTEDDSVNGTTGTYHEATEAEVQKDVAFGASSALTGTYEGGGGGAINLDKMGAL
jgi:hypothetical protein